MVTVWLGQSLIPTHCTSEVAASDLVSAPSAEPVVDLTGLSTPGATLHSHLHLATPSIAGSDAHLNGSSTPSEDPGAATVPVSLPRAIKGGGGMTEDELHSISHVWNT
jgi:hypothetical protein